MSVRRPGAGLRAPGVGGWGASGAVGAAPRAWNWPERRAARRLWPARGCGSRVENWIWLCVQVGLSPRMLSDQGGYSPACHWALPIVHPHHLPTLSLTHKPRVPLRQDTCPAAGVGVVFTEEITRRGSVLRPAGLAGGRGPALCPAWPGPDCLSLCCGKTSGQQVCQAPQGGCKG